MRGVFAIALVLAAKPAVFWGVALPEANVSMGVLLSGGADFLSDDVILVVGKDALLEIF